MEGTSEEDRREGAVDANTYNFPQTEWASLCWRNLHSEHHCMGEVHVNETRQGKATYI